MAFTKDDLPVGTVFTWNEDKKPIVCEVVGDALYEEVAGGPALFDEVPFRYIDPQDDGFDDPLTGKPSHIDGIDIENIDRILGRNVYSMCSECERSFFSIEPDYLCEDCRTSLY